ncbi:SARP family transcriptional regulator [Streptomyces triticagri]|uniref:SARP family transcriptional regulator n=1 Tax=Streptomyces triticagri TaxID=2293568 RepID=A0A372LUF0_9ACTN|nr:BTAD domain-containing putative transcriptional regulator [Streptomyces triticagri]RFU82292.1 SARP family transcriptional regulator [Streptomyces triticagri]
MQVTFGVLGPVTAWDADGRTIGLKGPRHRAVLARLVLARGRVVPVARLVEDLWPEPPADGVGAVRTFVAALRRALEPERPPRTPARLLVTEGPGYALRTGTDGVDARRFESLVATAAGASAQDAAAALDEALSLWRGPAYAEYADEPWARAERARLHELRLHAVERQAEARLALGDAGRVVPDLDAHVTDHPWREDAWRLLALALYRTGRQGDALAVLRRARGLLVAQLGVDPGPALRGLEQDMLRQAPHLDPRPDPPRPAADSSAPHPDDPASVPDPADQVWARAAAAYDRSVPANARARLESTAGLLRSLAVTGGSGLQESRRHRVAAVEAAEALGDPELTARVIGSYDVPAVWTSVDDPGQTARIVAAAERTLHALPADGHDAARGALLATIAVECRGGSTPGGPARERARQAAAEAERIARRLDDPALLAHALNAQYMQAFERTGLAPRRAAIGTELIALATRHALAPYEILGHLVHVQALGALGEFGAADDHARAAEGLAERHEVPLVRVFTLWYRALRSAADETIPVAAADEECRTAAAALDGAGMPGMEHGLLPLALLCLRLARGLPVPQELLGEDLGPYAPWTRPLFLSTAGRRAEAARALTEAPDPPQDLLAEALWCLLARAALALGDRAAARRIRRHLAPASAELAGAGSGVLTMGPVAAQLAELDRALNSP